MMKARKNKIDTSVMLTGLSYGEHVMRADRVVEDLTETLRNCGNSFIVRCQPDRPMEPEMYSLIAFPSEKIHSKSFSINGIYTAKTTKTTTFMQISSL